MVVGSSDNTPLLMVAICPSPTVEDPAWESPLESASVLSLSTPCPVPGTDHIRGKEHKIFSTLGISSLLSFHTPPYVSRGKKEITGKRSRRNIKLSFNLPLKKQTNSGQRHGARSDFKLGNKKYPNSETAEEEEKSPILTKSPETEKRKKQRLIWSSKGFKTFPGGILTRPTNEVSCERSSQVWISGTSGWSSVIQGLQSVALVFVVSLLSPVGAFCPRGCECDDVRLRSQCINADLDVIPILLNPSTLELNLSHNRIKTILEGLTFYDVLQYLDLAHNEVVSLGSQNFVSQQALHTLVINNNKVSKINSRAFLGLSKLTTLDLSDNYIETIENNAFGSLNHLKILNLSNNRIKNLTINTFSKLRELKVLDLCKNELKHVFIELYEPLKELQELYLCSNQIATIQNFAFKNLKGLVILKLSNNQMYHIHEKAFSGLDSLRFLGLKDNTFTYVPSLVFAPIGDLEELDFSINPLTNLPFGPFIHVPKLKSLHISRCENLSYVDSEAFASLGLLTTLSLSFNPQLTSLQRDVFKPLSSLTHLILRGNGLRTFDQSLVSSTSLQSLDLRDNRLECNCSIKWLKEASLNNSLSLKIEEILCAGPELLRGRSLSKLSEYDLECYNNVVVVASCAAASMVLVMLLVAFGIVYYKNCRKMKAMVHDHWPEKIAATWKDPEYQKQQLEDEEYTFHSLRGVQHIPVTVI